MSIFAMLRVVWAALLRNKLRSGLTALSVAIGVGLVVTVMAVGNGARLAVEKAAESMGTNLFMIWPSSTAFGGVRSAAGSQTSLTLEDAHAIREEVDLVTHTSGQIRLGGSQCVNGNKNWNTTVQGVETSYVELRNWPLSEGKSFTDLDVQQAARVCVLGKTVADKLFSVEDAADDGGSRAMAASRVRENAVGVTIKIRGMPFRVLGVLTPKGQSAMGFDQDDVVLIPISTALRRLGAMMSSTSPNAVGSIHVAARDAASVEPAMEAVKEVLRRRHKSQTGVEDFTVRNFSDMARAAADQQSFLALMLAAVAAVSLVVSGIGIMNIMLVSVTERTREIGIRLAVGAQPGDILSQFLLEALAVSSLGGALGIGLAYTAAPLLTMGLGFETPISPAAVGGASAVSIVIGVFFGFYPARKAARLDPIDALRYE
ncbi:MAG: ABC transporter permease [Planctomycetes bacterium]|nr:ABC transporter permease [Planctomycetota bacterium]